MVFCLLTKKETRLVRAACSIRHGSLSLSATYILGVPHWRIRRVVHFLFRLICGGGRKGMLRWLCCRQTISYLLPPFMRAETKAGDSSGAYAFYVLLLLSLTFWITKRAPCSHLAIACCLLVQVAWEREDDCRSEKSNSCLFPSQHDGVHLS